MPAFDPQKLTVDELRRKCLELEQQYQIFQEKDYSLDLTRGRPSTEQVELSSPLDGALKKDYLDRSGADTRIYSSSPYGLDEMRSWFAELMQVRPEETLVGGNSSLQLIYFAILFAWLFGADGEHPWCRQGTIRFLCPVPGYDRHFSICEELGITMTPVPMDQSGPDMDFVERQVTDHEVKGIFCVPRYSNPSGVCYSESVLDRLAGLGDIAARDFRIIYDNAYAYHCLEDSESQNFPSLMKKCRENGREDLALTFMSTSKITFAGAGVSALGASISNIQRFAKHFNATTIGTDRVNQLRHLRFLPDREAVINHMKKHAVIVREKFNLVQQKLAAGLGDNSSFGNWTRPKGGYFILFNTHEGLAREVVRLAREAGLRLTPAGATWPRGHDPYDSDIRLAPTVPDLQDLDRAMEIFINCIQLATSRNELAQRPPSG